MFRRKSIAGILVLVLLALLRMHFRSPERQSRREVREIAKSFAGFSVEKSSPEAPAPDFDRIGDLLADRIEVAVLDPGQAPVSRTVSRQDALTWLSGAWAEARVPSASIQGAAATVNERDLALLTLSGDFSYTSVGRSATTTFGSRTLTLRLQRDPTVGWLVHAVIVTP